MPRRLLSDRKKTFTKNFSFGDSFNYTNFLNDNQEGGRRTIYLWGSYRDSVWSFSEFICDSFLWNCFWNCARNNYFRDELAVMTKSKKCVSEVVY